MIQIITSAFLLLSPCHAAIYDVMKNVLAGANQADPRADFPLLSIQSNSNFSGIFTFEKDTRNNGVYFPDQPNILCQGALYKTWDTSVINATARNWRAVGLMGGYCYGDLSKGVSQNSFITNTNFNSMNYSTFQNLQGAANISFNFFSDAVGPVFNTTISAIQFGSHKFFDIMVLELNITNGDLIDAISPTFYSIAIKDETLYSPSIIGISSHTTTATPSYPRVSSGIFAGFGQYFNRLGWYVSQAVRVYYINYDNTGPLFTRVFKNSSYTLGNLIGFSSHANTYENLGSTIDGIQTCFTNGVFDITIPNCLPEYKCRLLNSILFVNANDLSATKFNSTITFYNKNVGSVAGNENVVSLLGIGNAQSQMYNKMTTLIDLFVDKPSANSSIPWFEYPAIIN